MYEQLILTLHLHCAARIYSCLLFFSFAICISEQTSKEEREREKRRKEIGEEKERRERRRKKKKRIEEYETL